jgi:hypothetical protein
MQFERTFAHSRIRALAHWRIGALAHWRIGALAHSTRMRISSVSFLIHHKAHIRRTGPLTLRTVGPIFGFVRAMMHWQARGRDDDLHSSLWRSWRVVRSYPFNLCRLLQLIGANRRNSLTMTTQGDHALAGKGTNTNDLLPREDRGSRAGR